MNLRGRALPAPDLVKGDVKMIKIAIVGANGKMGYFVAQSVIENPETEVAFGIDAYGENKYDFEVYKSFDEAGEKPDVIIDFSNPAALDGMLGFALKNKVPCVICTTGYSEEQVGKIKEASNTIPVFYSGNMSLGINLLIELSKQAATGHDEVVTVSHQAQSKEVFAAGAVNAAVFLAGQQPGMYDMGKMLASKFE